MVRLRTWLAAALGAFGLAACNALTGASDLGVGDCADCPKVLPSADGGDPAASGDGGSAGSPPRGDAGEDVVVPGVPGGFLDGAYGVGGISISNLANDAFAVAARADGSVYLGGFDSGRTVVLRVLPSGIFDDGFSNGRAGASFPLRGSALVLGANERPIVVGSFDQADGDGNTITYPCATRWDESGDVDQGFARNGVRVGAAGDLYLAAHGTAGGGVLLAGQDRSAIFARRFAFWRLAPNGDFDGTFGQGGKGASFRFGNNEDAPVAVTASVGGSVAVGVMGGNPNDMAIARITSAGALDATFAGTGKATLSIGTANDGERATAVAVTSANEAVVGGEAPMGNAPARSPVFGLARYDAAGQLDATFGTGGKLTLSFAQPATIYASHGDFLRAIFVDGAGRILVVGHALERVAGGKDVSRVVVARLTRSGAYDPLFADAGKLTFRFDPAADVSFVSAATIDMQGRLVVVGRAGNRIAVARITL